MGKKKLSEYRINDSNPRFISQDKLERLKKSINGFPKMMSVRPIVVDDNNVVLGGNMRFRALQELGYTEVDSEWIKQITELTDEQKKEFIIKDNVGFGSWDWEVLSNEWNVDDLSNWGLEVPEECDADEDEVQEDDYEMPEEIKTDIILGDLFDIGEHRLLCGDSTDSDSVANLMNGHKANMVFTDPPYDIENENYHSIIFLFTKDAHVFVMHNDKGIVNYLRLSKLDFSRFYVANFGFASPRGNDPYLSHILISQEKNGDAIPHKNMHDGFRSIIPMEYRFRLKDDKTGHKHQKPIKFVGTFIEHFSNKNDLVLDLFLGSGTTMVSAHQLNRKCYGMELDPKYCQVVIDRMIKIDPTLEVKKNGKGYKPK